MIQLFATIVALLCGYAIRKLAMSVNLLNKCLMYIVILILLVMGYELGCSSSDLPGQLLALSKTIVVYTVLLFLANFYACYWLLRRFNKSLRKPLHAQQSANFLLFIKDSGKYVLIIFLGMLIGAWSKYSIPVLSDLIFGLLFVLLFIIGHQMRIAGVSLGRVLFNRKGFQLSLIIILSSLAAGMVAALILKIPLNYALMLSSGFGWYTLSSILNTNLIDQNYGAMAFFIDFMREVIAIILIPSLGQRYPATLVAYCGGTAMDFSLPIIKQNLHEDCVMLAISSGMLLSISVPLLISIFAKL